MNHWYDNTISQGILKEKYYHKGEKTPQEFMDRVSSIFDPELKKRVRSYLFKGSVKEFSGLTGLRNEGYGVFGEGLLLYGWRSFPKKHILYRVNFGIILHCNSPFLT